MLRFRYPLLVLALLIVGAYLAYSRSEYVAPYFVSRGACGPVRVNIQSINLSGANRMQKHRFPVDDIGDPNRERYMNTVTSHLISLVKQNMTQSSSAGPFNLDVLFVTSREGLNASSRYDHFGSSARLVSPWVRITGNAWSPCSMQAIFFRQGRQIARDQMEMIAGKPLPWSGSTELSESQIREFGKEYQDVMSAAPGVRAIGIAHLQAKIPSEVIFAFTNSPHNDLGYSPLGFAGVTYRDPIAYAANTNQTLDKFFRAKKRFLIVKSVIENNYRLTHYQDETLISPR